MLLVETGDRLLWFPSWELTRSQPVATSGVAAPRGAGLGQTRLVVVSWEPSASATTGAGMRRTGIREERDHNGTVERERLLRQLQHLRRAVPDDGPPRAGKQLEEGTHPIRLLRELRPAGLLTVGRGAP